MAKLIIKPGEGNERKPYQNKPQNPIPQLINVIMQQKQNVDNLIRIVKQQEDAINTIKKEIKELTDKINNL